MIHSVVLLFTLASELGFDRHEMGLNGNRLDYWCIKYTYLLIIRIIVIVLGSCSLLHVAFHIFLFNVLSVFITSDLDTKLLDIFAIHLVQVTCKKICKLRYQICNDCNAEIYLLLTLCIPFTQLFVTYVSI